MATGVELPQRHRGVNRLVRNYLQLIAFGAPVRACTRHPDFQGAAVRPPGGVGRLNDYRPLAGTKSFECHGHRVTRTDSGLFDGFGDDFSPMPGNLAVLAAFSTDVHGDSR